MKYMKLWLKAYKLLKKREGWRPALIIMTVHRRQRHEQELEQLIETLEIMIKDNL